MSFLPSIKPLAKPLVVAPSRLTLALSACLATSLAHSAGLEYSQQPNASFFKQGNYAEVSYAYVNPNLSGKDVPLGNKVDNMMKEYGFTGATIKVEPSENTSLALFYNQPWGVKTAYPTGNMFNNDLGQTHANVQTDAIGIVTGGKVNNNVWLYGGMEHQSITGNVQIATPLGNSKAMKKLPAIRAGVLHGAKVSQAEYNALVVGNNAGALNASQRQTLATINGAITQQVSNLARSPILYTLDFEDDTTIVPMVGIAFEKPEIALRTSVTYRAPAKYSLKSKESLQVPADTTGNSNISEFAGVVNVEFPQSVSLDFQTGLNEKHQLLGMINARWVDWSEFEVSPPFITGVQNGKSLAHYANDQYSIEMAIAKQFTPRLAAEIRASYDSGTGAPLSALGPYDSVTGLAIGAEYDFTENLTVGAGAQYLWIKGGYVTDSEGHQIMNMDDSNGYALGMKIGYHF